MSLHKYTACMLVVASGALLAMDGPTPEEAVPQPLVEVHGSFEALDLDDEGNVMDEGLLDDPLFVDGNLAGGSHPEGQDLPASTAPSDRTTPLLPASFQFNASGEDKENLHPLDLLRQTMHALLAAHPELSLSPTFVLHNAFASPLTLTLHDCLENSLGALLVITSKGPARLGLDAGRSLTLACGEHALLASIGGDQEPLASALFRVELEQGPPQDLAIRFVPWAGGKPDYLALPPLAPLEERRALRGPHEVTQVHPRQVPPPVGPHRWPETRSAVLAQGQVKDR